MERKENLEESICKCSTCQREMTNQELKKNKKIPLCITCNSFVIADWKVTWDNKTKQWVKSSENGLGYICVDSDECEDCTDNEHHIELGISEDKIILVDVEPSRYLVYQTIFGNNIPTWDNEDTVHNATAFWDSTLNKWIINQVNIYDYEEE